MKRSISCFQLQYPQDSTVSSSRQSSTRVKFRHFLPQRVKMIPAPPQFVQPATAAKSFPRERLGGLGLHHSGRQGRGRTGKSPSAAGQPALIPHQAGKEGGRETASSSRPPSPSAPQAPSPRGGHLPPQRDGGQAAPTWHREPSWCGRGPGR